MKKFSELNREIGLSDDEILFLYDELPLWSAPFGLRLLDVVEYKKNMRVLDIGSGAGFPLIEIAQRLGDSSVIIGIEPWQPGIDKINRKIKLLNLSNVSVISGKSESLPFDSEYFDLIVSNNGINNVDDQKKTLSECRRVAKKDAQLVMTVNLPGTMIEFYKVFTETLLDLGLSELIPEVKKHIKLKRKSTSENINQVKNAGFKIIQLFEDSFKYKFADGKSFINYFLIKLGFMPSWSKITSDRSGEIFSIIIEKLNHIAENEGFITFNIPYICLESRAV